MDRHVDRQAYTQEAYGETDGQLVCCCYWIGSWLVVDVRYVVNLLLLDRQLVYRWFLRRHYVCCWC